MRIGSLELSSNLFLSPLAGYTNLAFRLTLRELGGLGWATTELVNARSLLEKRPKACKLIESSPEDRPLAVQLFGAVPEEMRAAAAYLESLGVSGVDINLGCPARKVCRVGAGSALLADLGLAVAIAKGIVEAIRLPVTAKMRLGWDEHDLAAPDLARALEAVGVAAVFIHGRTRAQGFSGPVNLAGIRAVVEAVESIPVIGNGDVTSPQAAQRMLEETGCAGVGIGRGAFYDPWIFRRTEHFLRTGELLPKPTFEERVRLMRRHLGRMVEVFGETMGCRMFRKIAPLYSRQFGPAREFNRRIVSLATRPQFEEILEHYVRWRQQFLDEQGELKPAYRPLPLTPSFTGEGGTRDSPFKLPKGAEEWW
jgi:nifR3 family TIM-barrel protein